MAKIMDARPRISAHDQALIERFNAEQGIVSLHTHLRYIAETNVRFHPDYNDWLIFDWLNHKGEIRKDLEADAARIVLFQLQSQMSKVGREKVMSKPTILGIENSGISFSESIHAQLPGSTLLRVHKYPEGEALPENDPCVLEAWSFTGHTKRQLRLPVEAIPADSTGLIFADDAIANGEIYRGVYDKCIELGLKPDAWLAYFAKLFEPGVAKIKQTGVPVFTALDILRIEGKGSKKRILTGQYHGISDPESENLRRADFDPFHIEPFKHSDFIVDANGQPVLEFNGYRVGNRH